MRTATCIFLLIAGACLSAAPAAIAGGAGIDPAVATADRHTVQEVAAIAADVAAEEAWLAARHARAGVRILDAPHYALYTPSHKQINDHFCGPATCQVIDDYWGDYVSQATYADYLGTTSAGTNFTLLDDCLAHFTRAQTSVHPYAYHTGDRTLLWTYNHIETGLYNKGGNGLHYPEAIDVKIDRIVWNNYTHDHAGHIIPLEAFDWRYNTVRLNDVYNERDYYTDGGSTYGHTTYPRGQVGNGIVTSLRPDLVY